MVVLYGTALGWMRPCTSTQVTTGKFILENDVNRNLGLCLVSNFLGHFWKPFCEKDTSHLKEGSRAKPRPFL